MEQRLQKLLSAAGVCSRRTAEQYITEGRVTLNGRPAQLGMRADPERDVITVDGTPLPGTGERVWLMLHKPRGYVTTLDDEKGRKTAAMLVADCGVRVWPVGRLDMDSEGLLLFTNDGQGTHRLLHPSHGIEKEYHVTVEGDVSAALPVLAGPMELDGELLAPAQIRQLAPQRLSVTIHQGKNRQVRRMCALAGLRVRRLCRIREGRLLLGDLSSGKWRRLTAEEIRELLA